MDDSRFTPPVRRSLTDAQLQEALTIAQADEAGILAAMNLLEEQAALRESEKLEFAGWEADLLSTGSPQAMQAINRERKLRGLELLEVRNPAIVEEPIQNEPTVFSEPPIQTQPPVSSEPDVLSEPPLLIEDVVANLAVQQISSPIPANQVFEDLGSEEEEFTAEQEQVIADRTGSIDIQDSSVEFAPVAAPRTFDAGAASIPKPQVTLENLARDEVAPVANEFAKAQLVKAERVQAQRVPKVKREARSLASSQFWSWAGLGGSIFPMGLAVLLSQANLSFGQGALALALGFAASGALVSVGALAGKRSGLGTLMLSRAAFGVTANAVPSIVLTITRILAAVSIFVLVPIVTSSSATNEPLELSTQNPTLWIAVVSLVGIGILASFVAIRGGNLLYSTQKWGAVAGFVAVLLALALMVPSIRLEALASVEGGGWLATLGAAALVFACTGLLWVGAGADFARRLGSDQLGVKVVSWVFLAVAVIPFIISLFGFAYFESLSDQVKLQFSQNFLIGLAASNPLSLVPVAASSAIALVVGGAMALYSISHSLRTLGVVVKPVVLHPIIAIFVIGFAILAAGRLSNTDLWHNLGGYILVIAVPTAAWAGIFTCDILIRRIAYHEVSLSRSYGFYKPANWINLAGWLVASAIGWGFTVSKLPEFSWLGYFTTEGSRNFWQLSNFAIVVSLAIGLLLPALLGIPRIKRQEAEVLSLEARRNDLKDIFGLAD
jgi:nucleobase:cation symporter-1, NCS1 family